MRQKSKADQKTTLRDAGTWFGGLTPSMANDRFWTDGSIPWATPKDFTQRVIASTEYKVTPEAVAETCLKVIPPKSLLVVFRSGILRRRLPVGLSGTPLTINQDVKACICTDAYNPEYLYHYLVYNESRILRECAKTGTTVESIDSNSFLSFRLIVPNKLVQNYITSTLSTWDRAIEQTERLLALKEKRKRALMQQLLTGKRRFSGYSARWPLVHLGDLFLERNETSREDLPLLSITADRGVIPRTEIDRKDTSNENKALYKRIVPGDIGYNTMRMWQGVSAVSTLEGIISPAYTVCIPCNKILVEFAGYLFKFGPMIHLFYRHSQGLVDDTRNLKYDNFRRIAVALPSLEEQRRIAAVLNTCDEELRLLRAQLEAFRLQKKGLMQRLLTGDLRVPESYLKHHEGGES